MRDIIFKSYEWRWEISHSINSHILLHQFMTDESVLDAYRKSMGAKLGTNIDDDGPGKWPVKLSELVLSGKEEMFRRMRRYESPEFVTDVELRERIDELINLANTLKVNQGEDEALDDTFVEFRVTYAALLLIQLEEAINFYNRQLIVIAATYIELILKDFLTAVFGTYPERMYIWLDAGQDETGKKQTGLVSFKIIERAHSIPDLLSTLSKQAVSNALQGSFRSNLNNLAKIAKKNIPSALRDELTKIIERRNNIVHEASHEKVRKDDIVSVFNSCFNLVEFLSEVAKDTGIPLDSAMDYLFKDT